MRSIHKYGIKVGNPKIHDMPTGAKFLHAGPNPWYIQENGSYAEDELAMWFEVETTAPTEQRAFVVAATGHELHSKSVYLGTVVLYRNAWHIQEIKV